MEKILRDQNISHYDIIHIILDCHLRFQILEYKMIILSKQIIYDHHTTQY